MWTTDEAMGSLMRTTPRLVDRDSASLGDRIARWTSGQNRLETAIAGLSLHCWDAPTEPQSYSLPPSICLIGQGRKRLFLGEQTYIYDQNKFLITSLDLPVTAQIIEADRERPYLGLTLALDFQVISRLMASQARATSVPKTARLGIAVSDISEDLLQAFNRLLDLLAHPDDIDVLAPLIKQEIFYRLLKSEQGSRLSVIGSVGHHGYQISRVIDWLKANFNKPVKVEELASRAGLSVSAFHNQFRAMTALSPLQYQKRMRLNEARRLMLTEQLDASSAAFEVGYESPSQFNREYSRQFGLPPRRDIKNLTESPPG
jgi:AraC-like DNA-binding protein